MQTVVQGVSVDPYSEESEVDPLQRLVLRSDVPQRNFSVDGLPQKREELRFDIARIVQLAQILRDLVEVCYQDSAPLGVELRPPRPTEYLLHV